MTIADNINAWLERNSLTVKQLAEKSGVSYNTLISIRNGGIKNPGREHLDKIAEALGITYDQLYAGPDAPPEFGRPVSGKYDLDNMFAQVISTMVNEKVERTYGAADVAEELKEIKAMMKNMLARIEALESKAP